MKDPSLRGLDDPFALPRPMRRIGRWLMYAALVPLALLDLVPAGDGDVLPFLSGVGAAVLVLIGDRMPLEWRASVLGGGSWALTFMVVPVFGNAGFSFGMLETAMALRLLVTVARKMQPAQLAMGLGSILGTAVIIMPLRSTNTDNLGFSFVLTFVVAGAVGLGSYLRVVDARRIRTIEAVRHGERMELARDLHDFVAHHVTGIVVQAQAARTVGATSPEQVEPLLRSIEKAGAEALASMRRLVRVLREEEGPEGTRARPAEGFAELAALAEAFSRTGPRVWLQISPEARAAHLAPEVMTSAHRVMQESLTNVRRHAPGTVSVTVQVAIDAGALVVVVTNQAPVHGHGRGTPLGGHGGFGLVGLRERIEAVGGELRAGPLPFGGWQVVARLPVLSMAGS